MFNASAIDTNNFGNVHFVSQADATAGKLAFVDSNNHVILKVDNTTNGVQDPTFGRNSVYLESVNTIEIGSLVVFDANHIPFGCSVWPSLFTQGNPWPQLGEIDIIENVNLATTNQYALHVGVAPCNQPQGANQTGQTTTNTNCTVEPLLKVNTAGCTVVESQKNSFGTGFAQNGGGVYAMQWDEDGVSMWFFPRNNIPSDISSGNSNPNPTTWPVPSAFYPASGCNPNEAFGAQIITLYIDICGAFAGDQAVWTQTCANVAQNCSDPSVVGNPTNYDQAFWDINYLEVFSTNPPNSSTNSSSGSSGSGSGGSGKSGAQSFVTAVPTFVVGLIVALGFAAYGSF